MTASPARPTTVLGPNRYGKAECRLVRVTRGQPTAAGRSTHRIADLNVSVALSGAMDDVHYSGGNAAVLPTDTMKNTVYAFAKEHGIASAEAFALLLARHFVAGQESIHRARVRVESYAWERVGATGHSFARGGRETRTAEVSVDSGTCQVVSGLRDLVVLNSTDSEFRGFVKDRYTTLQETDDRILATEVDARWRYRWTGDGRAPDWDGAFERGRAALLEAFSGTYSRSLQQTLYRMGARVVEALDEAGEGDDDGVTGPNAVDEVRLSLPNRHHFLVDLAPFGLTNDNEVYYAADRPYGLIEGTVLREGANARITAD